MENMEGSLRFAVKGNGRTADAFRAVGLLIRSLKHINTSGGAQRRQCLRDEVPGE